VIDLLAKVYHHDEIARERKLDPDERLKLHQERSGPVMEELKTWCHRHIDEKLVEPNSGIGRAIRYLLKHWEKLTRFLRIPKAPLDNSICYAAGGITDIMPTAGLCRVGGCGDRPSHIRVVADAA
jgi:transposase